jgi:hypothetical protein
VHGARPHALLSQRPRDPDPPHRRADHWRLLGCQLLGHRGAEIAKRIDVPAAALHARWTIERLNDLDLSYTPPFGTPWDAIQVAAQAWQTEAVHA